MASIFEELSALDHPWVDVAIKLGKSDIACKSRIPSSDETDALDAYFMDKYAAIISEKSRSQDGKPSELDAVKAVLLTQPKTDIIEQLVPTRIDDIRVRAYELAGINFQDEAKALKELPDEAARAEYQTKREAELKDAIADARKEVVDGFLAQDSDALCEALAQVNINVKAQRLAREAANANIVHYSLYDLEGNRVFKSLEEVRSLSKMTVESIIKAISVALTPKADLPLESQADNEPDGQQSSADTSAPEEQTPSTDGGAPTEPTPAS